MFTAFCGGGVFRSGADVVACGWIALVPALNAWLLRGGRGAGEKARGLAAGFVLVTAVFYGLLFLPLHPSASVIALICFGLGMLSLTPVLAAIATWWIGRVAWHAESPDPPRFKAGWRLGALAALWCLPRWKGPALWTRAESIMPRWRMTRDRRRRFRGLRVFHSERSLLKACYEGNRGTADGHRHFRLDH